MSKLVLFLVDGTTLDVKLDRERLTIGRRADNDLCLPYPAVSGEHAAVITILSDSFLEDLGSTNGTLVNGRPVTKHFLRDRDEIDIGRQKLVYVVDESATIASSSVSAAQAPEAVPAAPDAAVAASPSPPSTMPGKLAVAPLAAVAFAPVPVPVPVAVKAPQIVAPDPAASLVVRVLTGRRAGQTIALTKESTVIGRAGKQVAALRHTPEGLRVVGVEGEPPRINGAPAPAGGAVVTVGDTLEIAGASLEIALG